MPQAPTSGSEALRQFELDQYLIVDTLPESEYDDLARLAAHICDAPHAAVSLIDNDRQWFKARFGLAMQETRRDDAFCAYALDSEENELFVVPDAEADERFAGTRLVTDSSIRFYAGAPLINVNGFALGALCVMDTKPRTLTEFQRDSLLALGRIAMSLIEQRRDRLEMLMAITERDQLEDELGALRRSEAALPERAPSPTPDLVAATVLAGATIGYALGASKRRSSS